MRIVGVATAERSSALPDVPTFKSQGYDVVMGNWTAIMVQRLCRRRRSCTGKELLKRTFQHPSWKGMLEAEALEADFRKSQATRELVARDYESERAMLAELGMTR